jgi:hypothetical protein
MGIQTQLSNQVLELCERWRGAVLVGTGDGFLAVINREALCEVRDNFRPRLLDGTVSVGLGPTPKDA